MPAINPASSRPDQSLKLPLELIREVGRKMVDADQYKSLDCLSATAKFVHEEVKGYLAAEKVAWIDPCKHGKSLKNATAAEKARISHLSKFTLKSGRGGCILKHEGINIFNGSSLPKLYSLEIYPVDTIPADQVCELQTNYNVRQITLVLQHSYWSKGPHPLSELINPLFDTFPRLINLIIEWQITDFETGESKRLSQEDLWARAKLIGLHAAVALQSKQYFVIEAVLDLWGPDWTFDKVVFKEAQAVYKALDVALDMSYHLKIDGRARKLTLRPWDSDEAAEAQIYALFAAFHASKRPLKSADIQAIGTRIWAPRPGGELLFNKEDAQNIQALHATRQDVEAGHLMSHTIRGATYLLRFLQRWGNYDPKTPPRLPSYRMLEETHILCPCGVREIGIMAETRQESCTYEDLEGKGKKGEWRPNTVFVPLPGWWSEQKVNVPERKANVQKAKTKGKAKAKAKAQKAEADLQKVDEAEEFYAAFAEELLKSMET